MISRIVLAIVLATACAAAALTSTGASAPQPVAGSTTGVRTMKLRLTVGNKIAHATLNDSTTARDFASLLPLTLTMDDLFQREKYAHLSRSLSEAARHTNRFAVGDIAYWSPSQDVAIYYRQAGDAIPAPGVITIGRLDAGVEVFNVSGTVTVSVERAD